MKFYKNNFMYRFLHYINDCFSFKSVSQIKINLIKFTYFQRNFTSSDILNMNYEFAFFSFKRNRIKLSEVDKEYILF